MQIEFWNEVSSKTPNAATMDKLGCDIVKTVNETNESYEDLMSLDQDNINALGMYSGFLKKYNNTAEFSEVLMQKRNNLEESYKKIAKQTNEQTAPLSYFDQNAAIIHVSGDYETIGEISKVNLGAVSVFDFTSNEFVNNMNISQLIPEPFRGNHIDFMRTFHTKNAISYALVDNETFKWFFKHKKKHLFEARIMVKGVPHPSTCPFFLCIIKPTNNTAEEFIMCDDDWNITEASPMFLEMVPATDTTRNMSEVMNNWEEI